MIIAICDCCNKQVEENKLRRVAVENEHGMVSIFDIGVCCLDKTFVIPPTARIVPKGIVR